MAGDKKFTERTAPDVRDWTKRPFDAANENRIGIVQVAAQFFEYQEREGFNRDRKVRGIFHDRRKSQIVFTRLYYHSRPAYKCYKYRNRDNRNNDAVTILLKGELIMLEKKIGIAIFLLLLCLGAGFLLMRGDDTEKQMEDALEELGSAKTERQLEKVVEKIDKIIEKDAKKNKKGDTDWIGEWVEPPKGKSYQFF